MINFENTNNITNPINSQDSQHVFQPPEHRFLEIQRFNSGYYNDLTEQNYAINRAFEANNFNYLRKLPDQFHHKQILNRRISKVRQLIEQQKIERNKPYENKLQELAEKSKVKKLEKIGTLGFFQLFPYHQSEYDLAKQLKNDNQQQSYQTRKKISQRDFRPSDVQKKGKYEDPFRFKDRTDLSFRDNSDYLYHNDNNNYNEFAQSLTRQRIISQTSRIAGPFVPSMKEKTLGGVHKTKIEQILSDIEFCLKKNLLDYAYIIGVNKKDYIQILFQDIHEKDLKLKMFMSGFCEHEVMTKYKLRRDLLNYGIIENHYILFTLIPPWTQPNNIGNTSTSLTKELNNKN